LTALYENFVRDIVGRLNIILDNGFTILGCD